MGFTISNLVCHIYLIMVKRDTSAPPRQRIIVEQEKKPYNYDSHLMLVHKVLITFLMDNGHDIIFLRVFNAHASLWLKRDNHLVTAVRVRDDSRFIYNLYWCSERTDWSQPSALISGVNQFTNISWAMTLSAFMSNSYMMDCFDTWFSVRPWKINYGRQQTSDFSVQIVTFFFIWALNRKIALSMLIW